MSRQHLPRSVTQKANGRWQVILTTGVGSTSKVKRTYPTLALALEAHARGWAAREDGRDVGNAMDAISVSPSAQPGTAPAGCRTVGELIDVAMAEVTAIAAACDPSVAGTGKQSLSYRPGTVEGLRILFERHLRPKWGTTPVCDLDRSAVVMWMAEMASQGVGVVNASRALQKLNKLITEARRDEQPLDFPWRGVRAIVPELRTRAARRPELWDGAPDSQPPALPLSTSIEFIMGLPAALRGPLFMERLTGVRFGEALGLRLASLTFDGAGVLWADIKEQVDGDGSSLPWVKSSASRRRIPLPDILAEYLVRYAAFYHGYDLRCPDDERSDRLAFVHHAGRDEDGSFLPVRPTVLSQWLIDAREDMGLSHDKVGYSVANHHMRKTCSSELLHADWILASIEAAASCDEGEVPAHDAYEEALRALGPLGYSPRHVSEYLGHQHSRSTDSREAAAVTLKHYNLPIAGVQPLIAVARTMDRIARAEIGSLPFEPDESDQLPVHSTDDAEWLTVKDAAALIGIVDSNIGQAIRDQRLDGHLGWLADGGYRRNACRCASEPCRCPKSRSGRRKAEPAVLQYFVSARSAKEFARRRSLLSAKEVSRLIGPSVLKAVCMLVAAGFADEEGRWNPDNVYAFQRQLHDLVLAALRERRRSVEEIKGYIVERSPELFPDRKVLDNCVGIWLGQLVESGEVKFRRGVPVPTRPCSAPS